jgi:hypothetical protein
MLWSKVPMSMVEHFPCGMNPLAPDERGKFIRQFACFYMSTHANEHANRDPEGQPQLSAEQQKEAPVWRRPPSLHATPSHMSRSERRNILPQEILQHIVTDCSVCASISVCLEHAQRFGSAVSYFRAHFLRSTRTKLAACRICCP